jgi:hypothetical protein
MEVTFWYFLKSALTNKEKKDPIAADEFLGDVGDFVEINGVGYIICDFVVEEHNWDLLFSDNERW